jgi:rRNA maturation protein Nop10
MLQSKLAIYISCMIFVLRFSTGFCQELNSTQQKYLEEIVERIAESNENSPDLTTLFDDLNSILKQPLNLNSASKEEFYRLHLLNDFQIASLIDYRNYNGPFLSVYELLYIPGFRKEDVELLHSFVVIGDPIAKNSESKLKLKDIDHMIILRYQRVLEKQSGYLPVSDSVLQKNPDKTRMLGSPDKLYARYRISAGDHLAAGLLAEKDAGEEFFSGSNRQGFDFYSAYISYENDKKFLRKLIIGDYHVQKGQGLLLWSSYAMGKSSYIDQLPRRPASIKPNHSVDENRFLRGAAIELDIGKISIDFFTSYKSIDATLADSVNGIDTFESFRETGTHATPSEIRNEKSVNQTTIGSGIKYTRNRLLIGINGYYTSFNKTLLESDKLYKSNSFSGSVLAGASINYFYLGKRYQIFGESAIANRSLSLLNGILLFLNQNILIGAIHRFYQPSYYSYYSNAFSEGSAVHNEKGFFLGGEIRFSSYILKTYGDIFSFPWLKYTIDAPTEGNDFFIELSKRFTKADLYCRYRRREKPENFNSANPDILVGTSRKNQFRLNVQYWPFENFRMQNRIEMIRVLDAEGNKNSGFLLIQDISLKGKKYPVDLAFRAGYFNTEDYDVRLYAYESDIRFAYTNQMYYGKGWRFMAMVKWQAFPAVTLWLRLAQSYYPGKDSVGNGLTEIDKNRRTEIKIQTILRL